MCSNEFVFIKLCFPLNSLFEIHKVIPHMTLYYWCPQKWLERILKKKEKIEMLSILHLSSRFTSGIVMHFPIVSSIILDCYNLILENGNYHSKNDAFKDRCHYWLTKRDWPLTWGNPDAEFPGLGLRYLKSVKMEDHKSTSKLSSKWSFTHCYKTSVSPLCGIIDNDCCRSFIQLHVSMYNSSGVCCHFCLDLDIPWTVRYCR